MPNFTLNLGTKLKIFNLVLIRPLPGSDSLWTFEANINNQILGGFMKIAALLLSVIVAGSAFAADTAHTATTPAATPAATTTTTTTTETAAPAATEMKKEKHAMKKHDKMDKHAAKEAKKEEKATK